MADRTGSERKGSVSILGAVIIVVALSAFLLWGPETSFDGSDEETTASMPVGTVPDSGPVEGDPEVRPPEGSASVAEEMESVAEGPESFADGPESVAETPAVPVGRPTLDVVRVEADGNSLVAGRAQPGSTVSVLLDDEEVSRVEVGPEGDFATILEFPVTRTRRIVSLVMEMEGHEPVESETVAIIAPAGATEPVSPEAYGLSGADTDGGPEGGLANAGSY